MTSLAVDLYRRACNAGLILVSRDGRLLVSPSHRLTLDMHDELTRYKGEVLQLLEEAHTTTAELLVAAMNACDHWGDGTEAREAMRRQVMEIPPHLRSDLLRHLRATYPRGDHA